MFKHLIKQILPPILFVLARGALQRLKLERPIYDGLYRDAAELQPSNDNPFEHPNWISYVSERAHSRVGGVSHQDMNEMCLSLIASIAPAGDHAASGRIVDFGGGVGMYWPALKTQNKAGRQLDFTVVDSSANCALGTRLFGADGVSFSTDFESLLTHSAKIDVLNVSSTLQYCLDYEATLALLCRSQARFIIVSRHPAPRDNQPVAYTMQNVTTVKGFCGRIPVVLLSVERLAQLMRGHGYEMIANYYSNADSGKYWRNGKKMIPEEFSQIVDHALVFQKQSGRPASDASATSVVAP